MEESKENERAVSEDKTENEGSSPQKIATTSQRTATSSLAKKKSIVDEAREEREKIENNLEELKKERKKMEDLQAKRELRGDVKVAPPVEKTEFEDYEEKTKKRYAGTGLDPSKGYKRQF